MQYVIAEEAPAGGELVELYDLVGWSAYANDPAKLAAAVGASFLVLTARDEQGALVGLIRTVSDGHTIAYLQDILVAPSHQRQGIGGQLMDDLLERTASIRQVVLTTDSEERQRAFYESRGFVEVHDVQPHQLRSFVRLR
ncbi:GNAT family N-acetyltransferase [Pseudoclavibacter helvolus]|uniref:GNAT family N-acetyltransferase n=1 Tax=Pseudoclavibacter helvolus TaxID=255205 RepID=UPI000837F448|nr:GNAT family N-acetyltransferase [Pseudoclavibacter helvolus]